MFKIPIHSNGKQWLSINVIALLLLTACSSDMSDLEQTVAKIKAQENPNVEPLPKFEMVPNYFYEVDNMRDPFKPLSLGGIEPTDIFTGKNPDKKRKNCPRPNTNRVKVAELERLPLDALQMKGILKQGDDLYGLVVSKASGNIHQVRVGDFMGQYHGRITSISTTEIAIEEYIPDGQGCYEMKVNTIARQD